MRIALSPQAEEIVGKSELVIITERVDDVALLIGQMVKMGLPEVLDRHLPRHWEGVSHVLDLSEGSSKLIPINEEPNHQIVHLFRLGKANRPTH